MAKKSAATQASPAKPPSSPAESEVKDLGEQVLELDDVIIVGNPRSYFDPQKLQELGDSLVKHGQLQNCVARLVRDSEFELIAGERRIRGARLGGLTHLRFKLIECDDAMAIELRGIENYRRDQFNAIEEALWFQQMLGTGKYNQTTFAEYLGISAGQVSNRLRLLSLPDGWKDRIASGEIPATHARTLASWSHRPEILDGITAELTMRNEKFEEISVNILETRTLAVMLANSRSMSQDAFNKPQFEVTDSVRSQLDIEKVNRPGAEGEDRAFNFKFWDELQKEAEKPSSQRSKPVAESAASSSRSDDEDDSGDESESDEPVKVLSDYLLENYSGQFVAGLIGRGLKPGTVKSDSIIMRLLLVSFYAPGVVDEFFQGIAKGQDRSIDDLPEDFDLYALSTEITSKSMPSIAHNVVRFQLFEADRYFSLKLMIDVADELGLKPFAEWKPNAELLDACTDSQLRELFTEQMADPKKLAKWDRPRLIKELLEHWPAGYFPILLKPQSLLESQTEEK